MTIITIQTFVLLTAVFFLGCVAGCWFARRSRSAMQDAETAPTTTTGKGSRKGSRPARTKKSK